MAGKGTLVKWSVCLGEAMKACTAKGWAVWLFLVVLAVGRAGAQDDKNIVASHLGPVCDLSAALKVVAAKAKEARSCIPDDAAGGEGTDTVLFAKAFGAAWRWGADNTNDTVRAYCWKHASSRSARKGRDA
ncbi:hypothetical protein ERJ75_000809500 [Trypanosoma vivax]|nr:hypothetical protein ERJ75_000809500 [Trypanosoma vivax]